MFLRIWNSLIRPEIAEGRFPAERMSAVLGAGQGRSAGASLAIGGANSLAAIGIEGAPRHQRHEKGKSSENERQKCNFSTRHMQYPPLKPVRQGYNARGRATLMQIKRRPSTSFAPLTGHHGSGTTSGLRRV